MSTCNIFLWQKVLFIFFIFPLVLTSRCLIYYRNVMNFLSGVSQTQLNMALKQNERLTGLKVYAFISHIKALSWRVVFKHKHIKCKGAKRKWQFDRTDGCKICAQDFYGAKFYYNWHFIDGVPVLLNKHSQNLERSVSFLTVIQTFELHQLVLFKYIWVQARILCVHFWCNTGLFMCIK